MTDMVDFNSPDFLDELSWKSEYDIGDELIDSSHRRLFAVLRRVLMILQDGDSARNRNICRDAVKFLEAYTVKHFAEEEGFQRKIGYGGYKMHKALHDNLREVTLPSLKIELENNDYSNESIEAFISIFIGWLTGHIMVEDKAITGKVSSRWPNYSNEDDIDNLNKEVHELMAHVFHRKARLANRHYAGENLTKGIFYSMNFVGEDDSHYEVTFFAEEPVIFLMAGGLLGKEVFKLEKNAFMSYLQMVQSMSIRIVHMMYPVSNAVLKGAKKETEESLRIKFKDGYPDVSVMWRVPEGRIGICVEKID